MDKIAIRIDDFGASTKKFEVYGKTRLRFDDYTLPIPIPKEITNFLCFKKFKYWKGWAPYNEMTPNQIEQMIFFCKENNLKFSLAITAGWVDKNSNIIPYNKKFPTQLNIIKEGIKEGVFEVLSHGLTHCIVGKHLPRKFSSNRKYHREFYDFRPEEIIEKGVKESKQILEDCFENKVDILVPPGNVFGNKTIEACIKFGYKGISCNTKSRKIDEFIILGNDKVIDLHDKDFVEKPNKTYESLLINVNSVFISDLINEKITKKNI